MDCNDVSLVTSCTAGPAPPVGSLPPEWTVWPCSEATFTVNSPPSWYGVTWVGLQEVTWYAENRVYGFAGVVPWGATSIYPSTYFEQELDLSPYFGVVRNAAGARIDIDERYEGSGTAVSRSAEGGIDAWLMGIQVFEKPFQIAYRDDAYKVEYLSAELWNYEKTLLDRYSLKEKWIMTPNGFVHVEFFLTVDIGMDVTFKLRSGLTSDLQLKPVCLEPGVRPYLVFDVSADLYAGALTVGMKLKPRMEYGVPFCYEYGETPPFYVADPCITMDVLAQVYGCALWSFCVYGGWETLYEQQIDCRLDSAGRGTRENRTLSTPGLPQRVRVFHCRPAGSGDDPGG